MHDIRHTVRARLDIEARPNFPYVALAGAACAIGTFGLLENSVAIIIGAMLIAPLMGPIVGFAFAIVTGSVALVRRSGAAIVLGAALSVALSALLAFVVGLPTPGSEILSRSQPNLLDLGVALAAGSISGYGRIQSRVAETIGGTAIAVALMPPLCVVGIGIALGRGELAGGASLLFATNLFGITLACGAVFAMAGLATHHARGGLIMSAVLAAAVAVPLAAQTARLLEQSQLEATLRGALLHDTQTFRRVQLVSTSIDWFARPAAVRLLVRTPQPITPTQVRYLQAFAQDRLHRDVQLTVEFTQITSVSAGTLPAQ